MFTILYDFQFVVVTSFIIGIERVESKQAS